VSKENQKEIKTMADNLILACSDGADFESRWEYKEKLIQQGKAAVPTVLRLLDNDSVDVRAIAVEILGSIGDPSAVRALERVLENDPHTDVQGLAAGALAKLNSHRALGKMLRALDSDDWFKRMDTVRALARLGSPDAVPRLNAAAERLDAENRQGSAGVVRAAIIYIESGISGLERILNDSSSNPLLRHGAASLLDETSDIAAIPILLRCLHSDDEEERRDALQAMDNLTHELKPQGTDLAKEMVRELIWTLANNPSHRNRMSAAYLLKTLNDIEALPALERAAANDPHESTRRVAAEAVRKLRRRT
jgi:HEAT repeat protein